MLNEAPKRQRKQIDYAHPTKWQLFWRIQRESWRRMVTPSLMYFFMSLIMLSCQAIENMWIQILLGIVCIAGGAFFNGHLCHSYGELHYGEYITGVISRRNETFGIATGTSHRVEREYSPWKGFYIGVLIGVPVILLGVLAGAFMGTEGGSWAAIALTMFDGWAIIPITWIRNYIPGMENTSFYWSILMIALPILLSGIFYILGARSDKRKREAEVERNARIEEARKGAEKEVRQQTEEQRRKTLQSKKKK